MYNRLFDAALNRARRAPRTPQPRLPHPAFARSRTRIFIFREADRQRRRGARGRSAGAGGTCWKLIGSVGAAVVLLIGVLLPGAYSLLAGYQIQALRQEAQRLATEQASLELEEAQLLSPARMEQLAREQQFIDPPSQKVVYLDSKAGSLAMNNRTMNNGAAIHNKLECRKLNPRDGCMVCCGSCWAGRADFRAPGLAAGDPS